MKKVFSMFLILVMILPLLPANAQDSSCLIEFDGAEPTYSMSGTHAFISGHHNDDAITASYGDTTGWVLSPTADKTAEGYGYQNICINLPDSYMNNLPGTQDVLMDVCYYDGDSSDAGSKFCVYYVSQNHHNENAGIVVLGGSGEWKTHTFVLEKPKLNDIGNAPTSNIAISVTSKYMGTSGGEVVIASADVYYGEERDLFFTLDSENVGNIFFNDDPVILNMIFENPLEADNGDVAAELTLINQLTGLEYTAGKQISLGTALSLTEQIDLSELNLPFGMYIATAEIYAGDTLLDTDDTELSRLSAIGSHESSADGINNTFLGFNTHAATYSTDTVRDLVYLAKRSGIGFMRVTLGWEGIETTAGQYVIPQSTMTLLNEAKNNNIKIMGLLGNRSTAYPDYKPWRTGSTEENFQNYLTKYSAFVTSVVTQLKDYVECWEIYNEYGLDYPNYQNDDTVAAAAAKDYSDILKAGYAAVKAVDPDATVVGGAFDANMARQNFAGKLFSDYDMADYMDALSFHHYVNGSDTGEEVTSTLANNRIKRYNDYIATYGDNQELYLDEFNFTAVGGLSEEEQALYNVRLLTKLRYDAGLDRVYPYCLESTSYNIGSGYGFVDRPEDDYDYILKPAAARPNYAAFTFMNKLLRLSDGSDYTLQNGNHVYEFYDNIHERPVYVVWNGTHSDTVAGSVTIENTGTVLTAYDMYGNTIGTGNGALTVTTGKKPVYITGPEKGLNIVQDDETYKVTISGEGTAKENISIVVLNKGTDEEDFTTVNQILYVDQKRIDSTGVWEFTFKITQGNGEYTILIAEEGGRKATYNLNYNAGNLRVTYELGQEQGSVKTFSALADGNLDINYRIDNPENKNTGFLVFGCLYKGDELKKVVKSPDGQTLLKTDLIKTGSITIPDVKKSEIDKLQIMLIDNTDNLRPLVKKFVLE